MDGGHYTCFINEGKRNKQQLRTDDNTDQNWIKFDDLDVYEVTK